MSIVYAQWNHDGSVLAIGGVQLIDDKETNLVQFYNPSGEVNSTLYLKFNIF